MKFIYNTYHNSYFCDKMLTQIEICGNIGAGKTTLLKYLQNALINDKCVITEDIESWCNMGGCNLLENVYTNINSHNKKGIQNSVFELQLAALNSTIKSINKNSSKKNIITERSLKSNHEIFVNMQYDNERLSYPQYLLLKNTYEIYSSMLPSKKHIIFYLDCSPEICLSHIKTRNRISEKDNITVEYLNVLKTYHEKFYQKIKKQEATNPNISIIRLNVENSSIDELAAKVLQYYLP